MDEQSTAQQASDNFNPKREFDWTWADHGRDPGDETDKIYWVEAPGGLGWLGYTNRNA